MVGVIGKVNKEQVEEESDLSHLSSKELEILKQDMVASLDVLHGCIWWHIVVFLM